MSYWPERNEDWNTASKSDHWFIAIKERFNNDDFIARIDAAHDGTEQSAIGTP